MARDELLNQTEASGDCVIAEINTELSTIEAKPIIFVRRETPQLFTQLVDQLKDVSNRVVFIKNIELFDESVYDSVAAMPNIIISGNIDACPYGDKLLSRSWKTSVYFSQPSCSNDVLPDLPKYNGYFKRGTEVGLVSLD